MAKVLTLCLALLAVSSAVFADDAADRKKELERLKSQAAQKENELKKYREQERKISREISALETKKREAERLKNKVESDISYLEQRILSTEEKRVALERSLPMWQGVVLAELKDYAFTPECGYCPGGYSLEEDLFVNRMLTHKAQFAAAILKENKQAKQTIYSFEQKNKQLLAQSSKLEEQQEVITTNFKKKKSDLDFTKRKADAVRKEINELNKSAEELNNLLARFERKRKAEDAKKAAAQAAKTNTKPKAVSSSAKIDAKPKSLPWPVTGKVISKFGKEYRADLNTWIFRDGIKIAAKPNEPVRTVESGSVIYAGPFRSYGNVVIVDHNKGFFTIYGFLHRIEAKVGDKLEARGVLGTAGADTQQTSGTGTYAVYFEIRQGTTAVDPQDWLE